MKRVQRVLVTVATAVAVLAAPTAALAVSGTADRTGLQGGLDEITAQSAVGALMEVRDEDGVWQGTSGVAERGTTRPVPAHGRFRMGSITKTFLATTVLQLVAEGRLRLDDTLGRWLPGVVPRGHRITVRQLLNHTSGVPDYRRALPLPPAPEFLDNRLRTWSAAELIQRAVADPPTFEPPGSGYAYSNTGYLLLGQIVEKATGRPYGEEIERRIIRPLRLRGTSVPGTSPRLRGPHPHGYVPIQRATGRQLVDLTVMNPSLLGAGGEMISTTSDLNRFMAALLAGRLLPGHLLDAMRTPGTKDRTYGLGLRRQDTSCGIRVYGNDGDALAYQAWSFTTEDRRRQVTVALTPDFRGDPDDAVDALLDKAFCG
ncbi:D-alanyl-D-alanine carboxypeptidase precursor [Streptomyces sp. YIM 121038]|uniref:serine hydrolase domain-containing protein n=1 Tax=Streptomyces sp. YIM 121038 TaxID=2136401 RepID=UPI0011627257|nr:serine hydrolase domain-containing protein [Streptomyces sp. YIM 121038]QCX81976.1 D-alanyl-D-alanine carboxypeptidase precursor [Streptomyces sp. YIM 121038]